MKLKTKRALITGGAQGIGFAIAEAFLNAGARVAVNGKTEQSVSAAIERLGEDERLVEAPGDIGSVVGCESAVETAIDAFGGLDILVPNPSAGNGSDEAQWRANFEVDLLGSIRSVDRPVASMAGARVAARVAAMPSRVALSRPLPVMESWETVRVK